MMKKAVIRILVILAMGFALSVSACAPGAGEGTGEKAEEKQIYTDAEPVYKRFPDLPEGGSIQWCSRASGGIGLSTVRMYIFAFYDRDISGGFSDEEASDAEPDFYFVPENLAGGDDGWRRLENMGTAFQSGIKNGERIYTDVYINGAGNIIYMEAVWD